MIFKLSSPIIRILALVKQNLQHAGSLVQHVQEALIYMEHDQLQQVSFELL